MAEQMNLAEFTARQQAAREFNQTREHELTVFVSKWGGRLDGETLDDAVRRIHQMQNQYEQSLVRLREVAERVPPVPEMKKAVGS